MSSASELFARRELLWNLTLRELRGRYKRSVLGWGWSLLNPIAFMLVYTFAFSVILDANPGPGDPSGLQSYAFYLLCGLLPWSFFNISVTTAMSSIITNGALVRKVAFPREHLVVSTIAAGLFTLAVEVSVLSVALLFARNMVLPWLPLVVLTSFLVAVFATGFGLALAALNVYFRDMAYLWSIAVQAWFFATPIVYPPDVLDQNLPSWASRVLSFNPMARFVEAFRRLMYDGTAPGWPSMAALLVLSFATLALGWKLFGKLSRRFAEEL